MSFEEKLQQREEKGELRGIQLGRAEGEKIGRKEGEQLEKFKTVKRAAQKGLTLELALKIVGLSQEEFIALREKYPEV